MRRCPTSSSTSWASRRPTATSASARARTAPRPGPCWRRSSGVLIDERPDFVLVYGDTNSTLAGALAAVKLGIPVAHVEAGLRSYNRRMPEEINRLMADHIAALLFCPSQSAADNLAREGVTDGVHVVGDVMADALAEAAERAGSRAAILTGLGIRPGAFLLATIHRAENTDDPARLRAILDAFRRIPEPIVFPIHPRTRKALAGLGDPHLRDPESAGDRTRRLSRHGLARTVRAPHPDRLRRDPKRSLLAGRFRV